MSASVLSCTRTQGLESFFMHPAGFEPALSAWEAEILPLDYGCLVLPVPPLQQSFVVAIVRRIIDCAPENVQNATIYTLSFHSAHPAIEILWVLVFQVAYFADPKPVQIILKIFFFFFGVFFFFYKPLLTTTTL